MSTRFGIDSRKGDQMKIQRWCFGLACFSTAIAVAMPMTVCAYTICEIAEDDATDRFDGIGVVSLVGEGLIARLLRDYLGDDEAIAPIEHLREMAEGRCSQFGCELLRRERAQRRPRHGD